LSNASIRTTTSSTAQRSRFVAHQIGLGLHFTRDDEHVIPLITVIREP
jgi:hypothetical protein